MKSLFSGLLRISLSTVLSAFGAAFAVFVLFVIAQGGQRGITRYTVEDARLEPLAAFGRWAGGLFSTGLGKTWTDEPISRVIAPIGTTFLVLTAAFVLLALVSLCWAAWEVWRKTRADEVQPGLLVSMFAAPPAMWAAVITIGFNLLVSLSAHGGAAPSDTRWYFGRETFEWLRFSAATLVLLLGGGSLLQLKNGLRDDLSHLLNQEFILTARANGLGIAGRFLRNLAGPSTSRLVSRVPFLLGEVVVVELMFRIEGVSWVLLRRIEMRDAPPVLTITFFLVLVTLGLRGLTEIMSGYLTPEKKERVA